MRKPPKIQFTHRVSGEHVLTEVSAEYCEKKGRLLSIQTEGGNYMYNSDITIVNKLEMYEYAIEALDYCEKELIAARQRHIQFERVQ
jgi:hypothetical protein